MAKELKKLERQPPPGVSAAPKGGSVRELDVQLQGPPDSPYELGLFKLSVAVPDRYPFEPPKVQFTTPVYHPNIDAQGRICLDYLNMPPKGSWGPAMDLYRVLVAIRQLLAEPNPRDPLEVAIAEEYVSQPEVFKAKARQHVARYATPQAAAAAAAAAATAAAAIQQMQGSDAAAVQDKSHDSQRGSQGEQQQQQEQAKCSQQQEQSQGQRQQTQSDQQQQQQQTLEDDTKG
ncbi:hypothetical protein OEZ85_009379 [Tetradesmus obliquus]|uniref:UBC core domain-containing protein n=1 Tax=Tetradesmus obliquus TaxID=3088 RepID=A0ABY8U949_TETOB|nr:hypothetical protein OEZ85_009379 [Tetradesmus obliquus]